MRFYQLFSVILICWNVRASLDSEGSGINHGYPYNIDVPSVLRKYDIYDTGKSIEAKRASDESQQSEEDDETDYGTYEHAESHRDYEREYLNWNWRSYDQSNVYQARGKTCKTKECYSAAEEVKSGLDMSIDPCQDFDRFACGGWRSHNPIPKSQSQWTQFTKLWQQEEALLRDLIERQANSSANSSAALVYAWYSSCLNETERKKSGDKPLLELILQLDSCPLISPSTWSPHRWSFVDHFVWLNRLAIHPFFFKSIVDAESFADVVGVSRFLHRQWNILQRSAKSIHQNDDSSFLKLRESLGLSHINSVYSFRNMIVNILILESNIAKVLLRWKMPTYQKMTLNRLQREIPEFPWKLYIQKLYSNITQKKPITGDEMIGVSKLGALKRIAHILRFTPKSIKANFLMWNIAYHFSGDISSDYEIVRHRFVVAMYGNQQRKARWRECVSSTSAALSMALGKLFVEEHFDMHSKNRAEKIIEDIRQQLMKDFENISWMDNTTTKNAKEKAEAIVKNIGFPKFILNDTLVGYYYSGMSFSPEKFLRNIIVRRIVISRNTLMSREIKPNRARWSMAPQEINAYYSQEYNKIVFPAGILQRPFWHASYPMSMQYGGLGYIVGHEISHGFDVSGMHYDKNGNYISWWTKSSKYAFLMKSLCLRDQYSNYTIFGKHMNGIATLGENIADNGGIRLAYKAYQKWKKDNGSDEQLLPDFPFTNEQLFFLKGAQMWCANIRKKVALNMIDTDEHTLKMFRIIGPFSNSEAFSKAFKCPPGKRMNPVKKCRVW
ncbi:neprilysin-4-like [Dendronephthya gigantea]|uniref:neprilysin-4-like n=1 Tax=Dendronephthya gigantea TaxID=151771 RepID=UPI00106A0503|nr:neprilysin-4-like [Dendronephthya gigantea]